jgi:uncharacterized phiE125 gp8 family phage protein
MTTFGLKLATAPVQEPVSLTDVKRRLRVTVDDSDADLLDALAECRALCEQECGRAFLTQTWTLYLDGFPGCGEIVLPRPPLQSVTSVKYYDTDGVQQTVSTSDYHVDTGREPGRIWLASGSSWPAVQAGRPSAVEVRYVAGHANPLAVPRNVKSAILMLMWDRFNNPSGGDAGIPPAVRRALDGSEVGYMW